MAFGLATACANLTSSPIIILCRCLLTIIACLGFETFNRGHVPIKIRYDYPAEMWVFTIRTSFGESDQGDALSLPPTIYHSQAPSVQSKLVERLPGDISYDTSGSPVNFHIQPSTKMADIKSFELRDFTFEDWTVLPSAKLCYLDLNPEAVKTALVITCFKGRLQHTLNFADGAFKNYRVIVVALFGNGESSSPSNSDFPNALRYQDCVRAQKELLTGHLGLQSVDVVLGFSMGGQCTYHWTVMYPEFVRNAVIICSSARTSKHNYQFLEGPKAALENAVDYVDKSLAVKSSGPSRGLQAFGKAYSAWLASAEWFDQELYKSMGYETLEAWDHGFTSQGYAGWDPEDLLAKLRMWQAGDISTAVPPGEKTLEAALSGIKARVLLMPCQTDQYFRPDANERESQMIPFAKLEVIPSIWGHMAGGGANPVDTEWMDRTITAFLEEAS
jgi:homoserine acetyltransferase